MVQRHDRTSRRRAQVVAQMMAHAGASGLVTPFSREVGGSRQTLYSWTERGSHALQQAFLPVLAVSVGTPALER